MPSGYECAMCRKATRHASRIRARDGFMGEPTEGVAQLCCESIRQCLRETRSVGSLRLVIATTSGKMARGHRRREVAEWLIYRISGGPPAWLFFSFLMAKLEDY